MDQPDAPGHFTLKVQPSDSRWLVSPLPGSAQGPASQCCSKGLPVKSTYEKGLTAEAANFSHMGRVINPFFQ